MTTILKRPNANGTFQEFDFQNPDPSLHWQDVSDSNDATWILSSNPGVYETDTFLKSALGLPAGATINSVTVWLRGDGNAVLNVYAELLIGGVLYPSAVLHFPAAATNRSYTWNVNPATLGVWTEAAINAMEIGIKANANFADSTTCIEVWMVVDYTLPGGNFLLVGDGFAQALIPFT